MVTPQRPALPQQAVLSSPPPRPDPSCCRAPSPAARDCREGGRQGRGGAVAVTPSTPLTVVRSLVSGGPASGLGMR